MGRFHWRTDEENPDGHAVPYTAEEEAQADADAVTDAANEQREQGRNANADTLRTQARKALDTNAAYLTVAAPTPAQVRDQTAALTHECSAIIRLLLDELDSA